MRKVFEYALLNDITMILTSHSMEECEMLCSRLGILSKGQFECLGNIQNLKNKFGNIYSINIQIDSTNIDNLFNYLKNKIKIKISHQTESNVIFQVEHLSSPKHLFYFIEQIKEQFSIQSYSIQQITLEQIFISLQN
jgi:ABC-type multidrug transport system ATPase subunit